MPAKQRAIDVIVAMPENTNFDDIIKTLDIPRRNEKAMGDINAGRVYSTDETMRLAREKAAHR